MPFLSPFLDKKVFTVNYIRLSPMESVHNNAMTQSSQGYSTYCGNLAFFQSIHDFL